MSNKDLRSNVDVANSLLPAARAATGTGSTVDLVDYDSAVVAFVPGAWTDGTHTPSIQQSTDGTTFGTTGTADLQGSFTAISGTAGTTAIQRVGYIGSARYIRVLQTVAAGTTGMLSSAVVLRGHPNRAPLA